MIIKKILVLIFVLTISLPTVSSELFISSNNSNESLNISDLTGCDSHIIEDVPYVGQETNFFCAYASYTMLFKYYKINTSLEEVLYHYGVGYSLLYPNPSHERLPLSGYYLSQSASNSFFVASLYGLLYQRWYPNSTDMTEDENWQEYWTRIKQNISNDVPVLTSVDPFTLPSIRQQFDLPEQIFDKLVGGHAIVLIGYNGSNETVCYHDPAAAYFGNEKYGYYAWMNLSSLRKAITKTHGTNYLIESFNKIFEPLSKEDTFNMSHKRNIERLKGNISAYFGEGAPDQEGYFFGINASKSLKKDYKKGWEHRVKTISVYKRRGKLGIIYRLMNRLCPILASLLKIPQYLCQLLSQNVFTLISIEKEYTAKYLENNKDLPAVANSEATLLNQEAENWEKLSSYYSIFMKKGVLMTFPRAIILINKMAKTVDDITTIQQAIITGPAEV